MLKYQIFSTVLALVSFFSVCHNGESVFADGNTVNDERDWGPSTRGCRLLLFSESDTYYSDQVIPLSTKLVNDNEHPVFVLYGTGISVTYRVSVTRSNGESVAKRDFGVERGRLLSRWLAPNDTLKRNIKDISLYYDLTDPDDYTIQVWQFIQFVAASDAPVYEIPSNPFVLKIIDKN